jgi:hypothetical protein
MTSGVLTTKEVAEVFKCNPWKVLMMVKSGLITPIAAFGRPYRFDTQHVQNIISNQDRSLTIKKQVIAARSRPSGSKQRGKEKLWQE